MVVADDVGAAAVNAFLAAGRAFVHVGALLISVGDIGLESGIAATFPRAGQVDALTIGALVNATLCTLVHVDAGLSVISWLVSSVTFTVPGAIAVDAMSMWTAVLSVLTFVDIVTLELEPVRFISGIAQTCGIAVLVDVTFPVDAVSLYSAKSVNIIISVGPFSVGSSISVAAASRTERFVSTRSRRRTVFDVFRIQCGEALSNGLCE